MSSIAVGKVQPALHLPLNKTGALLPDDANTVSHVYWEPSRKNFIACSTFATNWADISAGVTTKTVNADVAPDGTVTAAKLVGNNVNTWYGADVGASHESTTKTFSVWLKADAACNVTMYAAFSGGRNVVIKGCAVTTNWQRFVGTITFDSGDTQTLRASLSIGNGNIIYAWGAQFEVGSVATDYIPTFNASRTVGGLVDIYTPKRTNLLPNSTVFGASKTAGGTGVTPVVTADQGIAPDGTMTADQIVLDKGAGTTTTDRSYVATSNTTFAAGTPYVFSVWLRTLTGTAQVMISPASGAAGNVVTVDTTWRRFTSGVWTPGGGQTTIGGLVELRGTYGTSDSCTLLAWGQQLEPAVGATPYIATTGSAVTVTDPPSKTGPRTNLLTYSQTASQWSTYQATLSGADIAPDGTMTAGVITSTVAAGDQRKNAPALASGLYTYSVWAKPVSGNTDVYIGIYNATDANFTATLNAGGVLGQWQRISVTFTAVTGKTYTILNKPSGSSTGVCAFWGAQLEQSPAATAYIPTYDAAVTVGNAWTMNGTVSVGGTSPFVPDRQKAYDLTAANNYTVPTARILDLGNTVDATIEAIVTIPQNANNQRFIANTAGSTATGVFMFYGSNGLIQARAADGTSQANATGAAGALIPGSTYHVAATYSWNAGTVTVTVYTNGVAGTPVSSALGSVTGTEPVTLGVAPTGIGPWNGSIYEVKITRGVALSAAQIDTNFRRVFGMLGTRNEPITCTRSTIATYEANGRLWTAPPNVLRIAPAGKRTNLLPYSDRMNTYAVSGVTVTSDAAVAPNGTQTATQITGAGGSYNSPAGIACTPSTPYVISYYVKSAGSTAVTIREAVSSGSTKTFDLSNGTGPGGSTGIVALPNGWYRIWWNYTTGAAQTAIQFNLVSNLVGSGLYVWGAQLEQGSVVTDWIKTGATSVTVENPAAALIEPAATNMLTYSDQFDNAAWATVSNGTGTTLTITPNAVTAPDGTLTGDTLTFAGSTAAGQENTRRQSVTLVNGQTYTFSVWLKAGTLSSVKIMGSWGTAVCALTTEWQRFSVTVTAAATTGYASIGFTNDGTQAGTVHAWGAQWESGSLMTSYVPTTTASVTRNSDQVSVSNKLTADTWSVSGTWAVANGRPWLRNGYFYGLWEVGDVNAANSAGVFVNSTSNGGILRKSDAGNAVRQTNADATNWQTVHRVTGCCSSVSAIALYRDGVSVGGAVTGAGGAPTLGATMTLCGGPSLTDFNGYLRDFRVFNTIAKPGDRGVRDL